MRVTACLRRPRDYAQLRGAELVRALLLSIGMTDKTLHLEMHELSDVRGGNGYIPGGGPKDAWIAAMGHYDKPVKLAPKPPGPDLTKWRGNGH
jgi:hypothetical protein